MQHFRKLLLLAFAGLGIGLAFEVMRHAGLRMAFTPGVGFVLSALAFAAFIFQGIRSEKLPLRSWYTLPLILGVGFGLFGFYNLRGPLFAEVSAIALGVSAAIFSFAALQYWADRKGAQEWYGIIAFCVLLFLNTVAGAMAFFAG